MLIFISNIVSLSLLGRSIVWLIEIFLYLPMTYISSQLSITVDSGSV